jgi:alpha-ketoglutarate-dependent taurine dioxygenase
MYATVDTLIDNSIRDLRGLPTERSPVESHHPVIRSHPVTGLKALNVTPSAVTGFAELTKKESGKFGLL